MSSTLDPPLLVSEPVLPRPLDYSHEGGTYNTRSPSRLGFVSPRRRVSVVSGRVPVCRSVAVKVPRRSSSDSGTRSARVGSGPLRRPGSLPNLRGSG